MSNIIQEFITRGEKIRVLDELAHKTLSSISDLKIAENDDMFVTLKKAWKDGKINKEQLKELQRAGYTLDTYCNDDGFEFCDAVEEVMEMIQMNHF